MPSHLHASPFFEPTPPLAPPPTDPELHKRIDKLVEYSAKNGPEFEAMIREKQQDNPAYSFLFGGDGHSYYRYKLWLATRAPSFASPLNSSPFSHQPNPMLGPTQLHHSSPFPPFYDHQQQQHQLQQQQQQQQPFLGQPGREYEPLAKFKGLSGPLPTDVAAELSSVLNNLTGTKESIKGAKLWFMQRSPFAPALAEALRDRVVALDDSERQLHIIYLANDILFDSLQRRIIPRELDNEALAFKPVLGSMLARIYHNPHNKDANQSRLQKILQFWASKEVYDPDTIYTLEGDMIAGPLSTNISGLTKEPSSAASVDSVGITGLGQGASQSILQWQPDQQRSSMGPLTGQDQQEIQGPPTTTPPTSQFTAPVSQHFLSNSSLTPAAYQSVAAAPTFIGSLSMPTPPAQQTGINQSAMPNPLLPTSATANSNVGSEQAAPHPYPLFPPGLIPGMVRKMQIGSGVPYSPMSPLDIPTVIPPSNVSPAYILERVSKFFKEIGEVNPSEGTLRGVAGSNNDDEDDEYERDPPVRKGGACIPPPPNLLQVDPETGTLPDGSVERKPGSGGGSGRLGLGATANRHSFMAYAAPSWFVYAAAFLAAALLLVKAFSGRRRRLKLPPGPKQWPIIGNLNLIGPLPHRSIHALSQKYGSIMQLRFGSFPVVVGSSVELAKEFLKTHDVIFAGRPKTAAGKYTTYNYSDITWSPYGPYWRQARKMCLMELFSVKRLDSYEYIRVEEMNSLIRNLYASAGKSVDIKDHLSTVSLNVISRMVLGKKYLEPAAGDHVVVAPEEFKKMLDELFLLSGVLNIGDSIPWLDFLDLQGYIKRMKALSKKFDRFLEHVLDEHSANRKSVKDFVAEDMVDVLLELADDPNLAVKLTRSSVKAFTQDLIAGGTESSAVTVEWAISEILKQPEIFKTATEELDRVIGNERWVEEKDIPCLPYIEAIVKETMRMHPVAPMLVPRMCRQDCTIAGYDILAGTRVLVNVWTIGRDPEIWEKPEEFQPKRFIGKAIDVKGQDFELLPFGSGRRMCPGYSLGLKVIQVSLANLLHGFTWRLPDNMAKEELNMEEIFGLSTPRKEPLVVVVEPRLPAQLYSL